MFTTKSIPISRDRLESGLETLAIRRLQAVALRVLPGSLRARLVVIVIVIDCLAALLTGSVIIWKARTATKLEIASAMQLAQSLVSDTIRLMQDTPTPILLQSIDLHFQSVRHVRIAVVDAGGQPVEATISQDAQPAAASDAPPTWFTRMVGPTTERKTFPIVVRHQNIGALTITSEPTDEIGEAWTYTHALLVTAACLNLIVLVALFLAFGRILAPLSAVTAGLKDLESKNYAVRLPPSSLAELATITNHFNRTAEALSAAHDSNRQLNRQLVTAQDDERRRTALELHDEVGPCLFALEANATSIAGMTKNSSDLSRVHDRALDVVALVERVQVINRRVLDQLRPMALGQIPLRDSLIKLLVDFDGGDSGPILHHDIAQMRESYGFLVDLTIYRCAQESLFNAVRHAHAREIRLSVAEVDNDRGAHVHVRVTDDGRGLRLPARAGHGVAGMRERVEALAGGFEIESSLRGTTVDIVVPVDVADSREQLMPEKGHVTA